MSGMCIGQTFTLPFELPYPRSVGSVQQGVLLFPLGSFLHHVLDFLLLSNIATLQIHDPGDASGVAQLECVDVSDV